MNNMSTNPIDVAKILAPIVSSRDLIDIVRKEIMKNIDARIQLDFKDVNFISRSAAHEMLVMKEDLARKTLRKKEISFVNTNPTVKEMFRVVAANRAVPQKPKEIEFKAEKIDIKTLVHQLHI